MSALAGVIAKASCIVVSSQDGVRHPPWTVDAHQRPPFEHHGCQALTGILCCRVSSGPVGHQPRRRGLQQRLAADVNTCSRSSDSCPVLPRSMVHHRAGQHCPAGNDASASIAQPCICMPGPAGLECVNILGADTHKFCCPPGVDRHSCRPMRWQPGGAGVPMCRASHQHNRKLLPT